MQVGEARPRNVLCHAASPQVPWLKSDKQRDRGLNRRARWEEGTGPLALTLPTVRQVLGSKADSNSAGGGSCPQDDVRTQCPQTERPASLNTQGLPR